MTNTSRISLLYVDDTVEQRYAMRRILENEGFTVLEAGTGAEALQQMSHHPALVILDVKLPDMSGYEVCRRLKETDSTLPVLQVSASFSNPRLRAAGLSGGADAYIAQPVYPAELVALVRTLLSAAAARRTTRFLSGVSLQIASTLAFPDTANNVAAAMSPFFADRCWIYLPTVPGEQEAFWPANSDARPAGGQIPQALAQSLREAQETTEPALLDATTLVAPLITSGTSLGAIAFTLESSRAYTEEDLPLARDLAYRSALALENCILYTSEQTTRAALIQAEKLAAAGRMSAAIAHEINNPLEAVTNLIYLIESSPEATPLLRERASAAMTELSRLAHITRQSLGFYRELARPSRVDLKESVEETLELYRGRIVARQITVEADLDPAPISAIGGEIRQVISNLVVNAMEAMSPGGHLHVRTSTTDGFSLLSVEDDGPGIPAAVLPRIFDPFFTTKGDTGTGLGLWISKGIVEKHTGVIDLRTSSEGTQIELRFPSAV